MLDWSDIPKNPTAKALRQFAAAWLVFFLAVAAHQYFKRGHHQLGIALGVCAIVIGCLGLVRPAAVRWTFVTWMVLAFPIGWLVSQVMLLLMFYGLITPVALIFRLRDRPDRPLQGHESKPLLGKVKPAAVRSDLFS